MASRNPLFRITACTALLAASASLCAQATTGTLSGLVTDPKGRPLAGVHITLKSPALFGDRSLVSNAKGEWSAQLLPVGSYQVLPRLDGYLGKGAGGIRIGIGANLRQDLILAPVQVAQATVEVIGVAAGVDKADAKTSVNYSSEQMDILPTIAGRGEGSALMMSVGVSTETISGQAAIRGGTILDTQITVNGTSIKDEVAGSVTHAWYVQDNLEDVQVMLSPLHARYGRAIGGQVNMVTKTGSNEFHGSIRADIGRSSWNATSTASPHSSDSTYDNLNRSFQATVNGPIIKDRLWFSLASILSPNATNPGGFYWYWGDRQFAQSYLTGNANIDAVTSTDVNTFQPSPGSKVPAGYAYSLYDANKAFPQTTTSSYVEGKLNAAVFPDHTVEFSFMKAKDTRTNTDYYNDSYQTDRIAALGTATDDRSAYTFAYNGLFGANDFLEFHLAQNTDKMVYPIGDPNYGGGQFLLYEYGATAEGQWMNVGSPWGATFANGPQKKVNSSASLNYKHLADWHGSHEIDLGIDYFQTAYDTDVAMGAQNRIFYYGGHYVNASMDYLFPAIIFQGPNANGNGWDAGYFQPMGLAPMMTQYLGKDGTVKDYDRAVYANDTWAPSPHWNLMLGLRLDTEAIIDTDGSALAKSTSLSPRFQARYDLKGNSRDLVTFTAARYESNFSQSFSQSISQNGVNKSISKGFSGIPDQALPGDPNDNGYYGVRFLTFAQLTDPQYYQTIYGFSDGSQNIKVAPDLKPQAVDEFTLGFQHFNDAGSSIRFTYVNRAWKRIWAVAQDYRADQMVLLQDPSHTGLDPMYSQVTRVFNSDELKRNYQSLELDFNIKTKGVWTFGGNWTFSRLTGNNEGGEDLGGGSNRINGVTQYYNNRDYLLNVMKVSPDNIAPNGRLVDDMTHRIRLFATAVVPMGKGGRLSFSWMLRYTTGIAFGAGPTNGIGEQVDFSPQIPTLAPNSGVAYPDPVSQQWNRINGSLRPFEQNDMFSLDFKLGWSLPLGLVGMNLIGDVTVNNLLNSDPPKPYNMTFMSPSFGDQAQIYVSPTTFGLPQAHGTTPGTNYWVRPRAIGVSVGLRF